MASSLAMQKIQMIGFFLKRGCIGGLKWKKISTNGSFGLHIYLHTK